MIDNKLLIVIKELNSVIRSQNILYDLLIIYSNEKINKPDSNIHLNVNSNIILNYNIFVMEEYIYKMEIINKKLFKNFETSDISNTENINLLNIYQPDIIDSNIELFNISNDFIN